MNYDNWLESGPGGPHDDAEIVCPDCEGDCVGGGYLCQRCDGTGRILASDHEEIDEIEPDDEDDGDALASACLGTDEDYE